MNAALVSGLGNTQGMVLSGSNLFVLSATGSNLGGTTSTISEYTTSGVAVSSALVSGLINAQSIAASNSELFVASYFYYGTGPGLGGYFTISEYTTSGNFVNADFGSNGQFNSGVSIAATGNAIFVGANTAGTRATRAILEFSDSGALVKSFYFESGPQSTTNGVAAVGPAFITQPARVTMAARQTASFFVNATGAAPVSYQWNLNGNSITGATDRYFVVPNVSASDAGSYTCTVTDANSESSPSLGALLELSPSTDAGRLMNISVLANCGAGLSNLVAGFVVGGAGSSGSSKTLLIRADGPELARFGVPGVLPDPALTVFNTTDSMATIVAQNAGWSQTMGNASAVVAADAQTGAFPLTLGSLSSALVENLPIGTYTANIAGASGGTGIAMAEIYDMSTSFMPTTARLINVSALANLKSAGAGSLIAGFVIGGSTDKTVLVRGIGPTLANFGISTVLNSPVLTVYRTSNVSGVNTVVASNTGWGGDSVLSQAMNQVYAFSLAPNTADCALVLTLGPGDYTANLTSSDNTSGIALVEVYEVP